MRVAVLGAGYAGLTVARRLERRLPAHAEIVVVDESDSHLVQHELHRVVRRPELVDAVTVPLDDCLDRATVRQARVTGVDPEAGVATLDTGEGEEELDYDAAAVCLGAETAFYGLTGVESHATPLKRLDDAMAVRQSTLAAPDGHAVVGGGGLSGVQVAGELAALAREEESALDVTVLEQADRVAPTFDSAFAAAIARELTDRGVTVETGATVIEADAEAVHLDDGRELGYDTFVWTGGIRGPGALGGERTPVGADLRAGDATFVVGDAARVTDAGESDVPASAQAAVREARVAAANIERAVADEADAPERFRFDDAGWAVSVGDGAVAQVGPAVVSGDPARAAKALVGGGHLGSVGAIGRASTLVCEELGWPTGADAANRLVRGLGVETVSTRTDPATPGELENPAVVPLGALAEAVTGGSAVDLTPLTRLADRTAAGSPAETLDSAVSASLGLFGVGRDRKRGREE
ncbi:NAD(P)/FAD-dependent oxidoreductase [Halorarius halobius]|uniref:NAD(P)/FAD-dependent oxidoreductase n=1 Tax=Halorarius halobius TaxID=2962671 RepID=UPI00331397B7